MLSDERLAEIEDRLKAATEGPWKASRARGYEWFVTDATTRIADGIMTCDAPFIAAARTDVPDLLAEVRRTRRIETAARDMRVATREMDAEPFRLSSWGDNNPVGSTAYWDAAGRREKARKTLFALLEAPDDPQR